MKTQVIATLADYFVSLGKKVLIVTPGKKANDEICRRIDNVFGIKLPSPGISNIITSGLLNRKDVKDPEKLRELEKEWASFDVVLVDEVEYAVNSDSGQFLFDRLINAEYMYSFSGTADKKNAELITFKDGLSENVIRNRNLIKYFGPSIVYRLPTATDVNLIKVKTTALASVGFDSEDFNDGNVYLKIITKLFTNPMVCDLMVKIIKRFPKLYIPINNLQNIINVWLDYFKGKFRILLICSEGYIYYDIDGNKTKLKNLSEACDYVRDGKVDVIPSTSAGFRALDLPGLENVLLLTGKLAGVVLQSIGRCGRGTAMNVICLDNVSSRTIPIYTKGMAERDEMIKTYYKYCEIIEQDIYETSL